MPALELAIKFNDARSHLHLPVCFSLSLPLSSLLITLSRKNIHAHARTRECTDACALIPRASHASTSSKFSSTIQKSFIISETDVTRRWSAKLPLFREKLEVAEMPLLQTLTPGDTAKPFIPEH